MDDYSPGKDPRVTTSAMTRRAFGQALGVAAVAGTAQKFAGIASAQSSGARPGAGSADELCDLSAIELVARIRRKEVSAREVMAAHLARIERINPRVNAIVTLVAERAMADAARGGTAVVNPAPSSVAGARRCEIRRHSRAALRVRGQPAKR